MEDRFEKRCDDIYFPFDVRLSGLDSHAEWLQKEVKAIQRQLVSQNQISASIDRARSKSIDSKAPATIDRQLVASINTTSTPVDEQLIQNKMKLMHEELNELSEYAYDKIGWHQISIENILERLQNISNAIQKMDEIWTRNDEDTRILKMLKWINRSTIHTCLDCLKEPKLTSNTKPDIIACLGAWYTWDRILQTSLEGQKEVNRAWWQPPLRLDSWKPIQSWSLILQSFRSLKEISSELTIRSRYEEEAINRCTSTAVDRYRREASTIEDYDRSMYILYHRSMSRRETRDLVPADFKHKASPNYKITPDEFLT
ncbi:hypothetical protein F2Q69_00022445 [Brassica cretica]|uniref:Uncharacterized protein n=1 Tax=Brassica cretica TaxID=69181 RepID=A0A8S9QKG1_BRACR|nr:hypothetical protein F2Q69_00022445 [Brassica cretica]